MDRCPAAWRRVPEHNDSVSHAGPCWGLGNSHFPASQRHRSRREEACVNHHSNMDTRLNHYGNVKHLPVVTSLFSHTLPPRLSSAHLFNSVDVLSLDESHKTYVHKHTHTHTHTHACLTLLPAVSHSRRQPQLSLLLLLLLEPWCCFATRLSLFFMLFALKWLKLIPSLTEDDTQPTTRSTARL